MHPRECDNPKKPVIYGSGVRVLASVIVSTGAVHAPTAHAEESKPVLEEIVVSAQKQEERLQDVPLSIQVVSGEALQARGITTLFEVTQSMPGVKIVRGGASNRNFIRGNGSGDNASLEQSVVRFIDDVYDGRGKASEGAILDIDRIEVLKGPQTTYFGNNAIGGAFNITTRKPTDDTDGYLRALYSPEDGKYEVEGAQNLPVSDDFRLRIAAMGNEITDGWLEDVGAGETYPKEDTWAVRVSALWEVTDRLTATFRVDSSDKDQEGSTLFKMVNCPPADLPAGRFCNVALADGQNFDLSDDSRSTTPGQMLGLKRDDYQATLDYDLGAATLTSVSAYTSSKFVNRVDLDGVAGDYIGTFGVEDYDQFSQELRLASNGPNTLEYMTGLYYQRSTLDLESTLNYPFLSATIAAIPAFAALTPYLPLGQRSLSTEDVNTYSAFGVLTWNVTDALSLSAGLRWTEVKKDFLQHLRFGTAQGSFETIVPFPDSVAALGQAVGTAFSLGNNADNDLEGTYTHLSPSARLQYRVTPDVMAYASYSDGFKSGGFQGNNYSGNPSQLPFDSEQVKAYEVGMKSEWFDQSLLLNVSAFRSDYSDLQVSSQVVSTAGISSYITNAASSRSQGAELEIQWAVSEHWRTGLSLTFLDSTYLNFTTGQPTPQQQAAGSSIQDLSGKPTVESPEYSGAWTIQYSRPISENFELRVNGDAYFSGENNVSPKNDPYMLVPAYEKYGASVTLMNTRNHWEVSIIGKNLTDETITTFCADAGATPGSYFCSKEDPRSVSVQARIEW